MGFGREKWRENDISLTKTIADAITFDQRISILGFRPYIQVLWFDAGNSTLLQELEKW